ncbi:MAG: BCD family MFS transporter [Burkholderiales bacterium]|jgi:BCD family chlorophyll transporter-like MFS transporter|nr:BCD family MFS transporter [Betaproteobacteria bacterium]
MKMLPLKSANDRISRGWQYVSRECLPFADAASTELPLGRLLRLSLFQVTVGMATALLVGTLNRVMIVELGVSAWLVSLMIALPLLFAPFRALVGFKSDTHRSILGWRRVPYIWFGSLIQFGGLAIMPFALLILSGDSHGPIVVGHIGAALAFLMIGAGLHTTQTAGLALATDLAPPESRPRVVALMYVMLLVGLVLSSFAFSYFLENFSAIRLIKVIQGAAVITMVLNVVALWKQEPRIPWQTRAAEEKSPTFVEVWQIFRTQPGAIRMLAAVGFGTAAFNMQDIILEPYGGEILGLSVSATSMLTAIQAVGSLAAFAVAAKLLSGQTNPYRLAACGVLIGVVALCLVIFSAPMASPNVFRLGALLIGFGGGLFAVATLAAAMSVESGGYTGLALGAWGAVQATAGGLAIAIGGALKDIIAHYGALGYLGEVLAQPANAYGMVYHIEILLLFATLVVIGPMARYSFSLPSLPGDKDSQRRKFGLAEFPS